MILSVRFKDGDIRTYDDVLDTYTGEGYFTIKTVQATVNIAKHLIKEVYITF